MLMIRATISIINRDPSPAKNTQFGPVTREKGLADSWHWSFTVNSAHRLFEEVFPAADVKITAYGNVLTAIAFLHGLVAEELCQKELDHYDPDYQVLITVRAVKPVLEE